MKNEFSTLDIVKALKIPRERLRDWMNRSFIKPSVPAEGQGTKAIFTLQDGYGVKLFQALIENGFSREAASSFVKKFMDPETYLKAKIGNKDLVTLPTDYLILNISADTNKVDRMTPLNAGLEEDSNYAPIIDLKSGITWVSAEFRDLVERKRTGRTEMKSEWIFLHVINFKAIREKVDEALKNL